MRRFEFVEGTSSKFWEVWCEGVTLHTRYGRLGATGQTTLKALGSEVAAKAAAEKLVREKTGKGYVETTATAAGKPAPKAPAAQPTAKAPTAKAAPTTPAAQPAPRAPAATPAPKAVKLTPFLKRLQADGKLRKALGDAGFGPEGDLDDLSAWAEVEADQRNETQLQLGDEWSPIRFPIDFLVDFPELEYLALGVRDGADLSPLGALVRLQSLKLTGATRRPLELSFLASMKKLEELDIRGPRVDSLAPLTALRSLRKLGITHGAIDDLAPLSKLALKQLFLPNQKLTSLAPLAAMRSLTFLQLPKNQLTDVAPLAKLTALTFLGLKDNQVRDVTPLAGLHELETLYLEGNPVADTTALRLLKKVRTKDFSLKAGPAPKVSDALKGRLATLAQTKECKALLEKLLTRLREVREKKGVVTLLFDGDGNDVVPFELEAPFTGKLAAGLPASFVEVVTKVGASVHVDAGRGGVDGPRAGVTKKGTVVSECAWEEEDRARFHDFCNAGQNWFVWDTAKKNKRGEPGIVFFSHEGALDPTRRFPHQDQVAFGVGGFVLRALAFRVFEKDAAWRGCGWG